MRSWRLQTTGSSRIAEHGLRIVSDGGATCADSLSAVEMMLSTAISLLASLLLSTMRRMIPEVNLSGHGAPSRPAGRANRERSIVPAREERARGCQAATSDMRTSREDNPFQTSPHRGALRQALTCRAPHGQGGYSFSHSASCLASRGVSPKVFSNSPFSAFQARHLAVNLAKASRSLSSCQAMAESSAPAM